MVENRKEQCKGRRKDDGVCPLHGATCKEIDYVRGLFKWGFGMILVTALSIGGLSIRELSKMHDTLYELKGDVKIIKFQVAAEQNRHKP